MPLLIDPYTLYPPTGGGGPTYGNAVSVELGLGTSVGTTATIGVQAYDNWVQQGGFPDFTATNLEDDTTTATTLDCQLSNGAGNNTTRAGTTPDEEKMLRRGVGINSNNSTKTTIAITQIPYSKYDVFLYFEELSGSISGQAGDVSDGTTTYYYESAAAQHYTGSWVRSDSESSGSPDTSGNYFHWEALTAASTTLTFTTTDSPQQFAACGLQIVERTD